jgi:serine/threonine protein kinase
VQPIKQVSSKKSGQRKGRGLNSFALKYDWSRTTLSGYRLTKDESKMLVFLVFLLASFVFFLMSERETPSYNYSTRVAPRIVILEDVWYTGRSTSSFTKGDNTSKEPRNRTVPDLRTPIDFTSTGSKRTPAQQQLRNEGHYEMHPLRLDSEITGCPFIADWQEKTYPTCNLLHEVVLQTKEPGAGIEYIASGATRDVWRVLHEYEVPAKYVLKTQVYQQSFREGELLRHRRDALIMNQAKASPYVLDIYGYCAFSVMVEAMPHNLRQWIDEKHDTAKPIELLRIAYQVSQGVADMHLFHNGMATAVHLDIKSPQFLYSGEKTKVFKVNDFNRGRLLTSKEPPKVCPLICDEHHHKNTERAAPEELISGSHKTDRTDVFSMGAVLYTLLTGEKPFKHSTKEGGSTFKEKIINGIQPRLPTRILTSEDPSYVAIADAIRWCREHKKEDRPSSQQVAQRLKIALEKAETSNEKTRYRGKQQGKLMGVENRQGF